MDRRITVGDLKLTKHEIKAVNAVLKSNQLSPGDKVKQFEREFSKAHGAHYGLFVNSGTDALRIGLAALKEAGKWNDGDGVIVPSVTFVATVNVVLQLNLTPVIMDAGLNGFNVDRLSHFETCTNGQFFKFPKVRAIMPVHLCGKRIDLAPLMPFVKRYKLKVLEDSCECMGVGPIQGDIACYSTYVCHLITTGVGGLAITNDLNLSHLIRSYANHGRDITGMPGNKQRPWGTIFKFDRIGYSARPTEIEAAIGIEQLKQLPNMIKRRREIAAAYINRLERRWWNKLEMPLQIEDNHAYMMFPIITKPGTSRDKLCAHLQSKGIDTRLLLPLINQPCYKEFNLNIEEFQGAKKYLECGFYIGCHQNMTNRDVQRVLDAFDDYFLC